MIPSGIRKYVPKFASQYYRSLYLKKQAKRLNAAVGVSDDAAICCEALWEAAAFRPLQRPWEILRLFGVVKNLEPKAICEIGAFAGGTAFLFTRASAHDAVLISIDLSFDYSRRMAIKRFARSKQQVFCLQRDSHNTNTLHTVASLLRDRPLDILFIDGDHSYEGVSRDFSLYSPLVRKGGLIIFHDIMPDSSARGGSKTRAFTGGVPQFWMELKSLHASHREIVEDPGQDGYGIGVLEWQTPTPRMDQRADPETLQRTTDNTVGEHSA